MSQIKLIKANLAEIQPGNHQVFSLYCLAFDLSVNNLKYKTFLYKIEYTSFNPGLALTVALTGVNQRLPNKQ